MCRRLIFLISLVLVPSLAGNAAPVVLWTDADPADHLWSTPNNWDSCSVPTITEEAHIGKEDFSDPTLHGPIIDSTMDLECDRLKTGFKVNPASYDGATITMTGGKLYTTNWFGHAEWTDHVATIYMSGGELTMLRGIGVGQNGYGYIYMTGGLIKILGTEPKNGMWIPGTATAKDGHLQLDAGTIDTTKFMMRKNDNDGGTMDITEGTLIIDGDPCRPDLHVPPRNLLDYIDNGWLTAYAGAAGARLIVTYDADANETTVIAWTPAGLTATNPVPRSGAYDVAPNANLSWTPGTNAANPGAHEIYMGAGYDDVNNATTSSPEYITSQDLDANSYDPGLLELGRAYYWRIDQVNAGAGQRYKGRVWSFKVTEGKAADPSPDAGAWDVPMDADLGWTPGPIATWHDVYLGTDFNDVNDAADPNVLPGRGRHDVNSYTPAADLELFTRYYWRIDGVSEVTNIKGSVWSFVTTVGGETVLRCDISNSETNLKQGWTLITKDSFTGKDNAITWSDVNDPDGNPTRIDVTLDTGAGNALAGNSMQRGELLGRDCFYAEDETGSPEADFIMTLSGLLPANYILTTIHNNPDEPPSLISSVDITGAIGFSTPDANALQTQSLTDDALGYSQVTFYATGAGDVTIRYACDDPNGQAYFNGFVLNSFPPDTRYAHYPWPYDLAEDVPPDVVLSWTQGDYAARHDVYFGTDWDDVNDADSTWPVNTSVYKGRQNLDANTYNPGILALATTYYWRIDEVNDPNGNLWKGDVWRFTTAQYLIIDDMESYNQTDNRIYDTWEDGVVNDSGAELDLGIEPVNPAHGGSQSMIYLYYNDGGVWNTDYYSEIEVDTSKLPIGSDWTALDVKTLTLYFDGNSTNDANEQMYVGLEDTGGTYVQVDYGYYGEDMNDIREQEWYEWNIAMRDFTGVDANNVKKLYIGFGIRGNPNPGGTPGGSGVVHFDNVRLYIRRCVPIYGPVADLNGDCVVDIKDVRVMAEEWLDAGFGTVAPTPPDDSKLVLQYLFDESTGTTVADNTVPAYTGTFFTDVNQTPGDITDRMDPGKSGSSFHFSTTIATAGISIPNDVFVDNGILQEITIGMWIKNAHPNETPDGGAFMWEFRQWDGNSTKAGERVLAVEVSGAGDNYGFRDDDDSVWFEHDWDEHTEWQHYAFVRDADYLRIHADGWMEEQDNSSGNVMAVPALLYLGLSADRPPGYTSPLHDGFTGNIDDFRIYSYALSYAEVLGLAEQTTIFHPLDSEANLYEPGEEQIIDFKDYAVLADSWLEVKLWPE